MSDTTISNEVINFTTKQSNLAVQSVQQRGEVLSQEGIKSFNKTSNDIITQSAIDINAVNFKYQNDPTNPNKQGEIDVITNKATNDIHYAGATENKKLSKNLNQYASEVGVYHSTLINNNLNKKGMSLSSGALSTLTASISGMVSGMSLSISSAVSNTITAFKNTINYSVKKSKILINDMINSFKSMGVLTLKAVKKYVKSVATTSENFYKRLNGESSTSQYIQTNVPNKDGKVDEQPTAITGTPDEKIINPQLKSDTNTTKTYSKNPLAQALGFITSLIPAESTKKISEPKPTSSKAQYGLIQVQETKGGFLTIKDNTPGNKTFTELHPTGSYKSIKDDGSKIVKTVGDNTFITDGDWNITTSKDKVEIIVGDSKIEIRKDQVSNIKGNVDSTINGTKNELISKDVSNEFKGNYTGKISSDYSESVGGDKTEKTSGDLTETISGTHKETCNQLNLYVSGNINIVSGGNTCVSSSGTISVASNNKIRISGTAVDVNSSQINLNGSVKTSSDVSVGNGASGVFVSLDNKVVTVVNGIITLIS